MNGRQAALEDAELSAADIDYISAHATSTVKGDRTEIDCLRQVFDRRLAGIPISANKSQIGHSLGAAAAIEAVLGIEAMRRQMLLPTINYIADPQLGDIDVVAGTARRQSCQTLLSNAFGFGGTNCCLVFKRV
jgi:3-oxoacyl-[acyl-carrier-protein] synthase II